MAWFRRLRNTLFGSRLDRDALEEMRFHLDERAADYVREGMTEDEARRAARRRLGNTALTIDRVRDADTLRWLDELRQDVRYSSRLLGRNPLFALTAVLSLAIGLGATTTIFSVANALLFRAPVGVADPSRLVDIGVTKNDVGFNPGSYANYLDLRKRATMLEDVYATELFGNPLSLRESASDDGIETVSSIFVTTNYFSVLGARPAAGRFFDATDERADPAMMVVLSHRFWTRRFNADPGVIGRTLLLNGQAFAVAGVASEGFHGTRILDKDVWLPMNAMAVTKHASPRLTAREGGWAMMGARLKPGVSVAQAASEASAIASALEREFPEENKGKGLSLATSSSIPGAAGPVTLLLALLMGIVSLVLLIACANLAGVLLARAATRRREIAVRLAIGAGRARLVRQLLTETGVLCAVGGLAGLWLARALTSLLVSVLPALPFRVDVSLALDGRVILFATGLSLVAAVLSGLVPALQGSKADVVSALKDESSGSSGRSRLRNAFVVAQIAFSIMLVVTAGLFVRALRLAGSADPGFDARDVELASIDLSLAGYNDTTGPLFVRELLDRARHLPTIQSATIARVLPGGFEGIGMGALAVPGEAPRGVEAPEWDWNLVEPGYFETLRIPMLAGRDFLATDRAGTQPVAILGEAAARYFWPGQTAVGKVLTMSAPSSHSSKTILVVGVAGDVKSSSLIDGLSSSFVYLALQQNDTPSMTANLIIAVRPVAGQQVAADIRRLVASMDPKLPIIAEQTLDSHAALGLVPQRVVASLSGSLGLVGLLLAAIGIYGVTAYGVTRRTRELGIRIALGATNTDILAMVLRQGLAVTGMGCAIGLALAAAISQLLTGFLFGMPPLDPIAFGSASALFVAIGLAACYGPARRATQIDATEALRHE